MALVLHDMASMQSAFAMPQRSIAFKANIASTHALRASVAKSQVLTVARAPLTVENRVAIRFTRLGRKKLPFYRIVAVDSRKRRDGRPLEYLGWYDPIKKEANLNAPAIKKWLEVGAQPSDTVGNLLKKAMIVDA